MRSRSWAKGPFSPESVPTELPGICDRKPCCPHLSGDPSANTPPPPTPILFWFQSRKKLSTKAPLNISIWYLFWLHFSLRWSTFIFFILWSIRCLQKSPHTLKITTQRIITNTPVTTNQLTKQNTAWRASDVPSHWPPALLQGQSLPWHFTLAWPSIFT